MVITRDIMIVGAVLELHFLQCEAGVKPSWMGKAATVARMLAIGFVMLLTGNSRKTKVAWVEVMILDFPVAIAGFRTLVSGFGYVRYGIGAFHSKGCGEAKSARDMDSPGHLRPLAFRRQLFSKKAP